MAHRRDQLRPYFEDHRLPVRRRSSRDGGSSFRCHALIVPLDAAISRRSEPAHRSPDRRHPDLRARSL